MITITVHVDIIVYHTNYILKTTIVCQSISFDFEMKKEITYSKDLS